MISAAFGALGLAQKLAIALALVSALGFAYWWVWSTGVQHERTRWERATTEEIARQTEINDEAREASELVSQQLLAAQTERDALVRRLSNEARDDVDAGRPCLGAAGVLRLNALSGEAPSD